MSGFVTGGHILDFQVLVSSQPQSGAAAIAELHPQAVLQLYEEA